MSARGASAANRLAAAVLTARAARRCLAIDARRPASWLGLAGAAGAGVWLFCRPGLEGATGIGLAIWAGMAAALASLGDPPGAMPAGRRPGEAFLAVILSRSVWPLVGAVAVPAGFGNLPGAVAEAGGVVAAAASVAMLRRRGADAAEAGGTTLLAGAVAVAATVAAESVGGGAQPGIVAAAAVCGWIAVMAAALSWLDLETSGSAGPADFLDPVGWPAASGRLAAGLVGVSMLLALMAMAAWLFLAPERAGLYGGLAAACFAALAVPRGTLAWGATGAADRAALLRSSAGPPRRTDSSPSPAVRRSGPQRPLLAGPSLGASGCRGPEWRAPLASAAILGWPPLVAALVVGGPEAVERVGLAALLGVWAASLGLGTVVLLRLRVSRETIQAIALLLAAAWFLPAAAWGGGKMAPAAPRTDVEPTGASCKNPPLPCIPSPGVGEEPDEGSAGLRSA